MHVYAWDNSLVTVMNKNNKYLVVLTLYSAVNIDDTHMVIGLMLGIDVVETKGLTGSSVTLAVVLWNRLEINRD